MTKIIKIPKGYAVDIYIHNAGTMQKRDFYFTNASLTIENKDEEFKQDKIKLVFRKV